MSVQQLARTRPELRRRRQAGTLPLPWVAPPSCATRPRLEDRNDGSGHPCGLRGAGLPYTLVFAFAALMLAGCTGGTSDPNRPTLPSMDSTLLDQGDDDPGVAPAEVEDPAGTGSVLTVSASPVPCCNPLSIDFSAELGSDGGMGGATYIEWDFGDGRSASGQAVNHTYAWADDYTVTVTVRLPGGETTSEQFALALGSTDDPSGPRPPEVVNPAEDPDADPPIADAGPDQQVSAGDTVVLDGSGSRPGGAGPLSYTWAQVSGPVVALTGINSAVARFTAPVPEAGQEGLVFQLSVAETGGRAVDVVTVWVAQRVTAPVAAEVTADAGPDQTVEPGTVVQLDGSGSSVPATPPAEYFWSQVSGPTVSLSSAGTSAPTFVAPDLGAEGGELRFELRVTSGDVWDTDGVAVRISGVEETTPEAAPVTGFRVVFLSGPEGAAGPGTAEVSWYFVDAPGASEVFLRLDCCNCPNIDTAILTPNAQGVYRATIDVPEGEISWYHVHYVLNGTEYWSQSVHVNPDPGDSSAPPPIVIWNHRWGTAPDVLHEVIRAGVVTHVMVEGHDRVVPAHDTPEILEAVRIAQAAGLKVIWSRWLWHAWEDFQVLEDTFDPEFYLAAMAQVQSEAQALGADYTALDCECYGKAPLDGYLDGVIPEENYVAMQAAIEQAAAESQVDFVYPSGAFHRSFNPIFLYPALGRQRVAEGTYYDIPQKHCYASSEFEVFGAFIRNSTERSSKGYAPFYLPQDIIRRPYLWSQQDGAPGATNGLFIYSEGSDSETRELARMLADAFD